jgi:hypothetical protein
MPPTIPDTMPLIKGAPEASATPRHKGRATKKTTIDAGISLPALERIRFIHSYFYTCTKMKQALIWVYNQTISGLVNILERI